MTLVGVIGGNLETGSLEGIQTPTGDTLLTSAFRCLDVTVGDSVGGLGSGLLVGTEYVIWHGKLALVSSWVEFKTVGDVIGSTSCSVGT